jgi:hypothetical protein
VKKGQEFFPLKNIPKEIRNIVEIIKITKMDSISYNWKTTALFHY